MTKKVLLIGGTGYVGGALYSHLSRGHRVTSVDLEWFGNPVNPANIRIDFRHLDAGFIAAHDVVVLVAAHSSVAMCAGHMASAFGNNVSNFVGLLGKLGGRKFIYAGSSSVYGETGDVPVTEDWHEFRPKTFYDLNKQEIDCYAGLSGVEYYGLRFGTVNGFSPNLRVDIMINKMFHTARSVGSIAVYNGHISRPILGVGDLCRGVAAVIGDGEDRRGVYNMASFNATIDEIGRSVASKLGVSVEDRGRSEAYDFSIDTGKFRRAYGFEFTDTVGGIVDDLALNYDRAVPSVRDRKDYV